MGLLKIPTALTAAALLAGIGTAAARVPAPATPRSPRVTRELAAALDALRAAEPRYAEAQVLSALREADLAPGDVAAAERTLEARFELTSEAARPLLESALRLSVLETGHRSDEPLEAGDYEQAETSALAALDAAPWSHPVIELVADVYFSCWTNASDFGASARLAAALKDLPDRGAVARRLAREVKGAGFGPPLLGVAIEDDPESPATLYLAALEASDHAPRIALAEAAVAAFARRPPPEESRLPLAFAHFQMRSLLVAGLHQEAHQVLVAMPPAIRAQLLEGAQATVEESIEGVVVADSLDDLRLPLAAMFLLEGETLRAQNLLAAAAPPEADQECTGVEDVPRPRRCPDPKARLRPLNEPPPSPAPAPAGRR